MSPLTHYFQITNISDFSLVILLECQYLVTIVYRFDGGIFGQFLDTNFSKFYENQEWNTVFLWRREGDRRLFCWTYPQDSISVNIKKILSHENSKLHQWKIDEK